jgi:DNA-binding transcriptional LysR family regulator
MEFRHLNTFRTVAAELSFTRAGTQLGYVQSAVTSHIKALEDELGVRLFDRLGRRIALTQAGSQLLGYADKILQLTNEATTVIRRPDEPAGPVIISAPEVLCTYRLPPVIRELHHQHPGIRLLFRASPTGALDANLRHALANGDVDTAFVLEEHLAATEPLNVEHLTSEPLVVVAAPQHPLTRAPAIEPADLDGVPVLLTDKGCGYRRVFERALTSAGARPAIAGEFTSGETVKRCVEAGTGIGVLALISVTNELTAGRLIALPWNGPALTLSTYLLTHQQRWISPAHAALRDATRRSFAAFQTRQPLAPHPSETERGRLYGGRRTPEADGLHATTCTLNAAIRRAEPAISQHAGLKLDHPQ